MSSKIKTVKIKLLKDYFKKEPQVVLAFLFGSQAKGISRKISDWDIGVYFQPKEYLELETERDYPKENKIWSDLIDILETDNVDLVVLNRARPDLVYTVLKDGLPLKMADRKLYLDLLCKTSYEAMDWWNFVDEFWKISERARSLLPQERKRMLERLKFLRH
jgi:predicted nucleotidyltransferase